MSDEYFEQRKQKVKALLDQTQKLYCPYFKAEVIFNSDGFHHLQFSNRTERNKAEQLLKFSLVPLALSVIRNSGTMQEYRKMLAPVGKPGANGFTKMKEVQYWAFVAIVGENQVKLRVVIRQVGDGNLVFWSVMPFSKLKRDRPQRLFAEGLEED